MERNSFARCLAFEESQMEGANRFYEYLSASNIRRCRWSTSGGKAKQKADIDLEMRWSLELNGEVKNKIWKISEKFRSADYPDIMLEIYDDVHNMTGSNLHSEADLLFYHTPSALYILDAQAVKEYIQSISNRFIIAEDITTCIRLGDRGYTDSFMVKGEYRKFFSFWDYREGEKVKRNLTIAVPIKDLGRLLIATYSKNTPGFEKYLESLKEQKPA